jgi:membrane associated rhomboid family serine protease
VRGAERGARLSPRNAPVTLTIIGICIVVFIADQAMGGALSQAGALYPPAVQQGAWWQLITSAFLHGSVLHIAFNMFALFQAGTFVEFCYGSPRYAVIYFTGLLGGSLLAYQTTIGTHTATLGASGAIMGIFGAMVVLAFKLPPLRGMLLRVAVLPILLTLANGINNPGISMAGHVGGLIAGSVVAFALTPVRGRQLVPISQDM